MESVGMKKVECFEQIIDEKICDYRKKNTAAQEAWAYLDSASDEQIIEAVEYERSLHIEMVMQDS